MVGQSEQGKKKKLTEAAKYWAAGGQENTKQLDEDAEAFGVIIEAPQESADFEVWPENWDAVVMWSRIQTQWRTSMSGVIGLDYSALAWLFKMYEVKDPRALLEDLQVMEGAALVAMSKES